MEFKDLKFKKQTHGGIGATVDFEGFTLSVQAGSFVYSTPREDLLDPSHYSSFEVAIFDNEGRFITEKFIKEADEVSGWTPRETIDELLSNLT